MAEKSEVKIGFVSIWSFLGSLLLIWFCALYFGMLGTVGKDFLSLVSGSVGGIIPGSDSFLEMLPFLLAVLAIEVPVTIFCSITAVAVLGKHGQHAVGEFLNRMKDGHHFKTFFVLVALEEIAARWFFLGFLRQWSLLAGPLAFYCLFLLGNGLWALVHLMNFKEKKDRNILLVLPQFVSGFFFTIIFLKFGLLASILTHFASNAVIFSLTRKQNVNHVDLLIVLYAGVCALVSYWLMGKPLADLAPWFSLAPTFQIEGWSFWDYFKAVMFLESVFVFAFGLLFYDREEVGLQTKTELNFLVFLAAAVIGVPIIFGFYWLMGFLVSNVAYRILTLAVLLCFFIKSNSASGVARTFWTKLSGAYFAICLLQALGFWWALAYTGVEVLVSWPHMLLKKIDD